LAVRRAHEAATLFSRRPLVNIPLWLPSVACVAVLVILLLMGRI